MRQRRLTRLGLALGVLALLVPTSAASAGAASARSVPDPVTGIRQLTPAERAQLEAEQGANGAELGQTPAGRKAPAGEASKVPQSTWRPAGVQGMDVSKWQGTVDWGAAAAQGARFAFVKATEGDNYISPTWSAQYRGAGDHGLLRGSYVRALPSVSSARAQAQYLVAHGGNWTADGKTLPPVLDIEFNIYSVLGNDCYDMTPAQLQAWVSEFVRTIDSLIGRHPVIYTNKSWWESCVGTRALGAYPLWIARYSQSAPALPAGWSGYHFWQYSESGPFAGDSDIWHASYSELVSWARAESSVGSSASAGTVVPSLAVGQRIASPNGSYHLVMQGDGNLVTYNQVGRAVWASGTRLPGLRLAAQQDGNLVLYFGARPLWWTGTHGTADRIRLQDDGNLVVRNATGTAIWDSFGFTRRLSYAANVPVTVLEPGQQAIGIYGRRLAMQTDGNLVYYSVAGKPLWSSRTSGRGRSRMLVQSDGNMVIYTTAGRVTWHSSTSGRPAQLMLQADGNLVLYVAGRAAWWMH